MNVVADQALAADEAAGVLARPQVSAPAIDASLVNGPMARRWLRLVAVPLLPIAAELAIRQVPRERWLYYVPAYLAALILFAVITPGAPRTVMAAASSRPARGALVEFKPSRTRFVQPLRKMLSRSSSR